MGYPEQFKAFREARGFSRDALASLAKCHRNTVSNLESGRPVKFATVVRLMKQMGYSESSRETKLLALLWLEAVTGIRVTERESTTLLREMMDKNGDALRALEAEIRRRRLDPTKLEALSFAAKHDKILESLRAIQELVVGREKIAGVR